VAEKGPKPEEKPAGKAAVKSKAPVEAQKTSPQASPPLAKDEAAVKSKTPVEARKTSPQASPPFAKEEEVKRFFSDYIGRYNQKDIDGFLSLFSVKAVQNQKDELKGIRKIYTKFFDQSRELRYQTEGMKIEIYQNSVEVKARFRVDQRLKGGGEEKVWKGNIRWVLVKEDGNLKISSLDYQNEKTP
jgi:ketosteroid isomerase-like protein